jgi:hypothetical protein
MTSLKFPDKDPDNREDFKLHWTNRLASNDPADTISTSEWLIVTSLTDATPLDQSASTNPLNIYADDIFNSGKSTRVWLEGGVAGQSYFLRNRVVTVGARQLDRTVVVKVKEQ